MGLTPAIPVAGDYSRKNAVHSEPAWAKWSV